METYAVENPLVSQAGGLLTTGFNLLPQAAQYQALYNQYRINWVRYLIIPQWDSYDPNNAAVTSMPRIAYSIQDTAFEIAVPPASETDIMTDNGCKIRALDKPLKISHIPVPSLGMANALGGFASVSKKRTWIDMNSTNVPHGYVKYWITNGGAQLSFKLYVKVSFSLKDAN